jgi:hypothetical protein
MLSIIFASRVKDNMDSQLKNLLDSTFMCVDRDDYPKIEFLIKYDWDDDNRPPDSFFAQYPFTIKPFVYARGEGRHYNNHHCEYLFANTNPSFKWVMNMSDDFVFTRKDFLKELEAIPDPYMVVGYTRPSFELNAKNNVYRQNFPVNFEHHNGIGELCPIFSRKLVEVSQNMGWQPNLDAWVVLLECTLYQMYGILLWSQIPKFYQRTGTWGSGDTPTFPGTDIYNNMTITGARLPKNPYLFTLIEQQAKNIYLNMVSDGIDVNMYKV